MAEEAGKPPLLLRGLFGFFRRRFLRRFDGGLVVQGEVDLRLGPLLRPALGRLQRHHADVGFLRLLLVLGTLPVLLQDGAHRQPQGRHQQHHEQHDKHDHGDQGRKDRRRANGQRAGNDAAGGQGIAAGPELRHDPQGGLKDLLTAQDMPQCAE